MFSAIMSRKPSSSSVARFHQLGRLNSMAQSISPEQSQKIKKRNVPGNPDPDAEVIALSPRTLLATNRFICEVCNKGFLRDQNLQLHRRGHSLPWKLKQRSQESKKKAYVCPEPSCVHHHPSRALGDLTGIKKHYCRKHGEKKWKCEKCPKVYAVQSDWKAHSKTCGTREYKCDCGTVFSRKDRFVTHRAFCVALAQESARISANSIVMVAAAKQPTNLHPSLLSQTLNPHEVPLNTWEIFHANANPNPNPNPNPRPQVGLVHHIKTEYADQVFPPPPPPIIKNLIASQLGDPKANNPNYPLALEIYPNYQGPHLSATALLQKAASVGVHSLGRASSAFAQLDQVGSGSVPRNVTTWQSGDSLTRDFLGLGSSGGGGVGEEKGNANVSMNTSDLLLYNRGGVFPPGATFPPPSYNHDHPLLKLQGFGFTDQAAASQAWRNF